MLNGCNRCGWVQRSQHASVLNNRCPRCGHNTSPVRYEGVYGPPRAGGPRGPRPAVATVAARVEDDSARC